MRYVKEREAEGLFNESIDDVTGTIDILGMKYCASTVLKEVDPTAYDCAMADWLDAEGITTDPDEDDEEDHVCDDGCRSNGCPNE
jgi:hypothetical protein